MKILVTPTSFLKPETQQIRDMLEHFADRVTYNETGRPLEEEELLSLLPDVDGYIAGLDYITRRVLESAPKLKVISRYGVGTDRVDLAAAAERGITVTNTPGANANAVAELTFALMMTCARNIPSLDRTVRGGGWPRSEGMELKGKTLALIGLGSIGKIVARRALAFDMFVAAYDPYPDTVFAAENGIQLCTLEEALCRADFLSLHLPLTNETRHLIGKEEILRMKHGAVIINTARGGLLDEYAVTEAVTSGRLRAAAADAFEEEPVRSSPLLQCEGVVLTPHTGAHTKEAVLEMSRMAAENCIAVLNGQPCANKVR